MDQQAASPRRGVGWRSRCAGIVLASTLIGVPLVPGGTAGAQNDPVRIVSLGDSYIAGTGAGAYEDGQGSWQPAENISKRNDQSGANCYQSRGAFPWRYAESLNRTDMDTVVRHAACHGARIRDIRDQWYTVGGSDVAFRSPDIILLSIGGNDAGFSTMVESCLVFVFQSSTCQRVLDSAEQEIDGLVRRIETEVVWLHEQARQAKIALVTYPHLTSPTCVLNSGASRRIRALQEEHVLLATAMAERVNEQLGRQVIEVIDPSPAFAGRGPCATTDRLLHLINLDLEESFHPTSDGHRTYAEVLLGSGLHTRLSDSPEPPPGGPSDPEPTTFEELAASPGLHRGHSIVLRLYWAVLARTPDVEGARFWIEAYDTGGWSTRHISRHFALSREFTDRYGSELTDEQFVRLIYRNVLERDPDPEGLVFWVGQLGDGMERAEMILLVSNDSEFIANHPLPSDARPDTGPRG